MHLSHHGGGGFFENVPRMLPEGIRAKIHPNSFPTPAIFNLIADRGGIPTHDMYNTFNMGIGLVMAINRDDVGAAHDALIQIGEHPYVIGCCTNGEKGVELNW